MSERSNPVSSHGANARPLLLWWVTVVALMISGAVVEWRARAGVPSGAGMDLDLPWPQSDEPWRPLALGLVLATVEGVIAFVVLRPATYRHSWLRATSATLLLLPFGAFALTISVHGGKALAWHALGVCALIAGMIGLAFRSLAHRMR